MNINFDMDGTLADFYGVPNWLEYLEHEDTTPYKVAKPLLNMATLARKLNALQRAGHKLGIISWTSKNGTDDFNKAVAVVKMKWLEAHLPSVKWDYISIIPYGTPKGAIGTGILFDDEEPNRVNYGHDGAYKETEIMSVLNAL